MTNSTKELFGDLLLDKKIVAALTDMGFEEPSPIQRETIPLCLAGEDVIGQAQTGTGKTAAFGIPIIQNLTDQKKQLKYLLSRNLKTKFNCLILLEHISER